MSSESRIASSRANGAKSRGPKTAAGKLRSSQNSRRHGMLSKTVVLENERPAAFSDLLAAFEAELQPANRVEKVCVDTMAVAHWRLMRLWGIQKAGLQSEMRRQVHQKHDNATSTADAFRTLCDQSRVAGLLLRYETCYHRQYARALNLLLTWKNSKRTQETPCEQALNKESEPTENPDRTHTEPTGNPECHSECPQTDCRNTDLPTVPAGSSFLAEEALDAKITGVTQVSPPVSGRLRPGLERGTPESSPNLPRYRSLQRPPGRGYHSRHFIGPICNRRLWPGQTWLRFFLTGWIPKAIAPFG